jgi:hypothetical protein
LYVELDGYWVYAPNKEWQGFVEAWFLREIADKLDDLNKEWDDSIKEYFDARYNNEPQDERT